MGCRKISSLSWQNFVPLGAGVPLERERHRVFTRSSKRQANFQQMYSKYTWIAGRLPDRVNIPSKMGTPVLKKRYFAVIGSYSVKTVADRYRHVVYYNKWLVTGLLDLSTSMTLNDLEPPPQNEFLVNFWQFFNAAHISTLNCDEMAGDRAKQPAHEIFSIERRF